MFGLFKKTSELEKLQKQYERLLAESHKLSTTNRSASDKKIVEAQIVLEKIETLSSK